MSDINWKLEDDYATVTMTVASDPPIEVKLNALDLDVLLRNLGDFRGAMTPPIPAEYAMGQKVIAVPDPAWVTEPDALQGDSLLHIRDPRFGWLHYLLPKQEASKLAQYLQKQVDSPAPTSTQHKAN